MTSDSDYAGYGGAMVLKFEILKVPCGDCSVVTARWGVGFKPCAGFAPSVPWVVCSPVCFFCVVSLCWRLLVPASG